MEKNKETRKTKYAKYRPDGENVEVENKTQKIVDNTTVEMNSLVSYYKKKRRNAYLIYFTCVTIFALIIFMLIFLGIE